MPAGVVTVIKQLPGLVYTGEAAFVVIAVISDVPALKMTSDVDVRKPLAPKETVDPEIAHMSTRGRARSTS